MESIDCENVCGFELSSLFALINMLKLNLAPTPEVYRTLLAVLCDYDPSIAANKEKTVRYIKLLVTDKMLAKCLLMSLPEGLPESRGRCLLPIQPKFQHSLKSKKMKSRLGIRTLKTKRLAHLLHPQLFAKHTAASHNHTIKVIVKKENPTLDEEECNEVVPVGHEGNCCKLRCSTAEISEETDAAGTDLLKESAVLPNTSKDLLEQEEYKSCGVFSQPLSQNKQSFSLSTTTTASQNINKSVDGQPPQSQPAIRNQPRWIAAHHLHKNHATCQPQSVTSDRGHLTMTLGERQMNSGHVQAPLTHDQRRFSVGSNERNMSKSTAPNHPLVKAGQGHLQINSMTPLMVPTSPETAALHFQYPGYPYPIHYPGMANYPPGFGFHPMIPWQPFNVMAAGTSAYQLNTTRSTSQDECSLDLSLPGRTNSMKNVQEKQKQPSRQQISNVEVTKPFLLKRSFSEHATNIPAEYILKPKLVKLNADSLPNLSKECMDNKERKIKTIIAGTESNKLKTSVKASLCNTANVIFSTSKMLDQNNSIQALQELTASIGSDVNKKIFLGARKSTSAGSLKITSNVEQKSSDNLIAQTLGLVPKMTPLCNSQVTSTGKSKMKSRVAPATSDCMRTFPYSQQIKFPDGKCSLVNFSSDSFIMTSTTTATSSSQLNVSVTSGGIQQPLHMFHPCGQMSNCDGRRSSQTMESGDTSTSPTSVNDATTKSTDAVVEIPSRNMKSTQVRIKLDKYNSGLLLSELKKLTSSSSSVDISSGVSDTCVTGVSSSSCETEGEIGSFSTVADRIMLKTMSGSYMSESSGNMLPGKTQPLPSAKCEINPYNLMKNPAIEMEHRGTLVQSNEQQSNVSQTCSGTVVGRAFSIQTKPDIVTNRISIKDKALLQTLKERLKHGAKPSQQMQKQRAYSDSDLLSQVSKSTLGQHQIGDPSWQLYLGRHTSVPNAEFQSDEVDTNPNNLVCREPLTPEDNIGGIATSSSTSVYSGSHGLHGGLSPYLLGLFSETGSEIDEDDDVFLEEYITPNVIKFRPKVIGVTTPRANSRSHTQSSVSQTETDNNCLI